MNRGFNRHHVLVTARQIAACAAVCLLYVVICKHQKQKRMRQVLQQFSLLGSEHNLSFSSQEVLANCVIGLDGINRKLLVMIRVRMHRCHKAIIHLNEVKKCSLKKVYGSIYTGDLKFGNLEQHLKKMVLQFEFLNNKPPVEIPFYNQAYNGVHQLPEIEKKARRWEAMLSRMLKTPTSQKGNS
jgi:hypothetical protein